MDAKTPRRQEQWIKTGRSKPIQFLAPWRHGVRWIALAGVVAAGCASLPRQEHRTAISPAAAAVSIDNFSYTPAEITVAAGARVTWTNHDDVPHTVTAVDKSFGSKAMDTDDTFGRVFERPGTYEYFCAVHPHMTGRVIVK
jgi:plastocyanin